MIKPIYYLLLVLFLLMSSVYVPLKLSVREDLDFVNAQFSALKAETNSQYIDLESPRVREILKSGHKMKREKYKQLSSIFALVSCLVTLGFAYFFKYASRYDPIVILAVLALLFALGSIELEYFGVITVLSAATFYLKLRN